ncbi:hypothetical protein PPYR_13854 [Photinus pyralis]|uniref:Protein sleepless n=1 Tax=Photinus pyralis TaxID=7054 RepID=A0A1Y1KHC4_PHOPY|nr:uncharacterized protein LOC116178363 [Photinus pyralis]KAB0794234.1 hypothetical protein PPYR_13854 [Photinus pyralis]
MKRILLIACTLIASGQALKCYHCQSEVENGCKLEAKPQETNCGKPAKDYQIVCVYKAFYDGAHHRVSSGCETLLNTSPIDKSSIHNCEDDKGTFKVKECRVCNTELCNSADARKAALILLQICLPIAYLANKMF